MRTDIVKLGETIHDALLDHVHEYGTSNWNKDLACACAVGSYFLAREARRLLGIAPTFVATPAHCFVEYSGHIYDPTATQFGRKEKVYVIKKPRVIDRDKLYRITGSTWLAGAYAAKTRYGIMRVNREWPDGQRPKDYRLNWVSPNKTRIKYIGSQLCNTNVLH